LDTRTWNGKKPALECEWFEQKHLFFYFVALRFTPTSDNCIFAVLIFLGFGGGGAARDSAILEIVTD
jgi:hypothetical protein